MTLFADINITSNYYFSNYNYNFRLADLITEQIKVDNGKKQIYSSNYNHTEIIEKIQLFPPTTLSSRYLTESDFI